MSPPWGSGNSHPAGLGRGSAPTSRPQGLAGRVCTGKLERTRHKHVGVDGVELGEHWLAWLNTQGSAMRCVLASQPGKTLSVLSVLK